MASYDDVKTTNIAYIGFMSVIVTVIIILLLQVLYFQTRLNQAAAEEATAGPPTELANLTATQQTALTRVEVVDREKGVVTVGIQRAMDLVISELDEGKRPQEVVGPLGPPVPTTTDAAAGDAAGATAEDQAGENPGSDDSPQDAADGQGPADDGEPSNDTQPPEKQDEDQS